MTRPIQWLLGAISPGVKLTAYLRLVEESASRAGVLLGLLFDPEDGGDMMLRNVHRLSPDYKTLYSRR
jgi:hypothetical protein